MAGKAGRSGRKAKTAAEHKAAGTYRAHRHAGKLDSVMQHKGRLVYDPPECLNDEARKVWRRVRDALPEEALSVVDVDALTAYCETVVLYRVVTQEFTKDPLDRDLRMAWKEASTAMDRLGRQFGWTPQARAGIKVPEAPQEEDAFTQFMKNRMGAGKN